MPLVMARKNEKLSLRQTQSQRIMREKGQQIRRQNFFHKFRIFSLVVGSLLIISTAIWAWKTSAINLLIQTSSDKIYGSTVKMGFSVKNLYVEGRKRTSMAEIEKALGTDANASLDNYPILRLNLDEIRSRLEQIESIKYATIERALPDSIYIRITEREPVAIWQYKGKKSLVDDNGVVMNDIPIYPYESLPLIVGENAQKHIMELLSMLATQPELAKRFSSAIWVGDRRWNVRMRPSIATADGTENIEIRLPEKKPARAWNMLAEKQKKQQILDRNIRVIDLRIDGKVFIKIKGDGEIN